MASGQKARRELKGSWRSWLILAGTAVLVVALVWYFRRPHGPSPPRVELPADADPALLEAVAEARQQIDRRLRSAEAWGHLGRLLLVNAQDRPALLCLAHAEQLDPADARWPYYQGFAHLLAEPEKAIPCFERAVARLEGEIDKEWVGRMRLANTLLAWGRFSQAEEEYRRLLTTRMKAEGGRLKAGDGSSFILHPSSLPVIHWGLGCVAMAQGDWTAAKDHLEQAKDSPWTQKKACSQLAQVYRHLQQFDLASRFQERARRLPKDTEPDDPFLKDNEEFIVAYDAWLLQVDKLRQRGRWNKAEEVLRRLINNNADDYRAYVKLGEVLAYKGDFRGAQEVLEKALPLATDQVKARFFLTVALYHQGEQLEKKAVVEARLPEAATKFQAAAEQARQTIALQANHPLAHVYLGLSLKHLGQRQEALAALRQALLCGPESVDPHLHLGKMLAELGQKDEARKHLENAVRVAPATDPRPRQELEKLAK
jgi:tetratricopeptide (TPR) repeat protein